MLRMFDTCKISRSDEVAHTYYILTYFPTGGMISHIVNSGVCGPLIVFTRRDHDTKFSCV
jgi:hypothetical protein